MTGGADPLGRLDLTDDLQGEQWHSSCDVVTAIWNVYYS
jgi:hypothetical protein